MLRPFVSPSVLLVCFSGCSNTSLPKPSVVDAPPAAVRDRATDEIDILESVYRYQFEHDSSGKDLSTLDYLFLARGDSQREYKDPPAELLARFAQHRPAVEAWSTRVQVWNGVTYGSKAGKGIIFYVGRFLWIDEDTVQVCGGHDYASRNASDYAYRVERRDGAWSVVSARLQGQS